MSANAGAPLGGPAEEARRLVEALGEWASTRVGTAEQHVATGSPECQLCPVCQLISAFRGDRPELLARLGDAWAALLGVLNHPDPPTRSHPSTPPGSDAGSPSEPPVRPVQNIDVR